MCCTPSKYYVKDQSPCAYACFLCTLIECCLLFGPLYCGRHGLLIYIIITTSIFKDDQHCILDLAPAYSSGAVKMYRPAGQQGPQAQQLGAEEGCAPGSGCVSPAIDRIKARLPVPSRPAWTLPMQRQPTETTGSRHWHRSILMPETAQEYL